LSSQTTRSAPASIQSFDGLMAIVASCICAAPAAIIVFMIGLHL